MPFGHAGAAYDWGQTLGARILIIDDDADWQALLGNTLRREGFDVTWAATGSAALACLQSAHFDLVILDVRLPDCKGDDLCLEIRKQNYVPIIMVSGFEQEAVDREVRLRTVADYFFQKPVTHREIVAQVWALLRMTSALKGKEADANSMPRPGIPLGILQLDFVKGEFKRGDHLLALTSLEIKLLVCLNRNAGRLVTLEELIRAGWKDRLTAGEARDRLKSAIKRLRRKIEPEPKHPRYLITIRGDGYYLCLNPKLD